MENQTEKTNRKSTGNGWHTWIYRLGSLGFYMETTKPLGTVDRVAVKGT